MNGAPRETGGKGEELDAVLGRFQGWMATQRASGATAKSTAKPRSTSTAVPLARDAREVSYEQALRATSYRRPTDPPYVPAPVPASSAVLPKPEPVISTEATSGRKEPTQFGMRRKEAPTTNSRPAQTPWPHARFTTAARVAEAPPSPASTVPVARMPAAKSRPPNPHATTNRRPAPTTTPKIVSVAATTVAKLAEPPSSARKSKRVPPAFRDVLQGTASLASASKDNPATIERAKTTALTLRVSDQEQARIQACAAQAGLSLSAYLRQCALGVDELRDQVETALIRLREQKAPTSLMPPPLPAPPPGISAIPGILGRFAKQWLRRLRGSSGELTTISIR